MARTVAIDEDLFLASVTGAGNPGTIGGFTRALRGAIKDAEVTPLAGLDLPRSLEAIMKVAKHYFDLAPSLRSRAAAEQDLDAAKELADAVVATGVWLRSLHAPEWLYSWLEAGDAFATLARVAHAAEDDRLTLHWLTASLLVPATVLGSNARGASPLVRADIARLIEVQRTLGTAATEEELESWHDLLAGYQLFR